MIFDKELDKLTDIEIGELDSETVDVKPRDYDFSSENWAEGRESGGWLSREPRACEECGGIVIGSFSAECENEECERFGDEIMEDGGPMMNYYYPIPFDPTDDALSELAHLPLCFVEVDGEPGLALTGGGMDLSWEICEGFMRLGLLPPLHFAGLPAMAGRGESADDIAIARACERSADVFAQRGVNYAEGARMSIERALAMPKELREREAREAKQG